VEREEALALEARRKVYALVRDEPGLHLRELERRLAMPLSTLRHHLRFLEEKGLVDAVEDRNQKRWFTRLPVGREGRPLIAALRQKALRRVVLVLLERGGQATYRDLLATLGLPPSTLGVHLAELGRRGVVEREAHGRESRYRLADPSAVVRTLHTYRASFLDALVDHLLDAVYQEEPETDGRGG
jgi:predicted transcriptional regulator